MGTHISRVKSVDLDTWTDEQLQSVLKWGNARANKSVHPPFVIAVNSTNWSRYWEAKLAPGHVPSEAYVSLGLEPRWRGSLFYSKIENFIRTKYDSKRWVMDGGMPDPATLDVSDDDVVSNKSFLGKFTTDTRT